jgi:hypothetical protein
MGIRSRGQTILTPHICLQAGRERRRVCAGIYRNPPRKVKPAINVAAEVKKVFDGVLLKTQEMANTPQKPMLGDKYAVQMPFDGVIGTSIQGSSGNTSPHLVASRRIPMTPSGDTASLIVYTLVGSGAAMDAKQEQKQKTL